MYCRHCGKQIADESKFCPSCGRLLSESNSVCCPVCGVQLPEKASFCPACGAPAPGQQQKSRLRIALIVGAVVIFLIVLLLVQIFCFSFLARDKETRQGDMPKNVPAESQEQNPDGVSNIPDNNPDNNTPGNESDELLTTDYYSLKLPPEWKDVCEYEILPDPDGYPVYTLVLYDAASHRNGFGGELFSISLFYSESDYNDCPSYQVLGRLVVRQADVFDVVVFYPTDVQFDTDDSASYQKLQADIDKVVDSFTPDSTYAFYPAS